MGFEYIFLTLNIIWIVKTLINERKLDKLEKEQGIERKENPNIFYLWVLKKAYEKDNLIVQMSPEIVDEIHFSDIVKNTKKNLDEKNIQPKNNSKSNLNFDNLGENRNLKDDQIRNILLRRKKYGLHIYASNDRQHDTYPRNDKIKDHFLQDKNEKEK